jgi:energy-coupling factor transport system permease protein
VPLARVNPVAQLLAMALVTVVLLASLDLVTPAVLVAAELCLLPAAGLAAGRVLLRRTWPMLIGATAVAVVNVVLSGGDVLTGVGLGLRVVGLALPGVLLVSSTDPVRLADALTVHWRVSTRFAYGALAALRLAPLLVAELDAIRLARRTRGMEAGRNPVAALRLATGTAFALLVAAVRRASRLATAMDARGFDSGIPRSNARGSRLHPRDAWFVAGTALVCAVAVTLSVVSGAWAPVFVGG